MKLDDLVVAMDYDGVLSDLHTPVVRRMNGLHGLNVSADEVTFWDFWRSKGLSDSFYEQIGQARLDVDEIQPYVGAQQFLQDVMALDFVDEVYILTANPQDQIPLIRRWLEHHGFPKLMVICAWKRKKADFLWDFLIDDNPKESPAPVARHVIHPKRPWNASHLETWTDILTELRSLAEHL